MIAVIADDLTGAAELAGLGLRYGLTVEVVTTVDQPSNADLLVVATDTRSMPEQEGVRIMSYITVRLKRLNPTLLFKKVDSVLRGHVIAELNAHLQQLDLSKALLVPANPALGRTMTNGSYFVDGQPIHLSSFANDPEFGIANSAIHHMLRVEPGETTLQASNSPLPIKGIVVGECADVNDLKSWAAKIDGHILLAGGSGFFRAVLEALGHTESSSGNDYQLEKPVLFVCGSTFSKSRLLVEELNNSHGLVSYMPQSIVDANNPADALIEAWADEVINLLNNHQKAVIAVHETATVNIDKQFLNLREKKARLVEKVFAKITVKELLIEGGATAAAVIRQLNFNHFTPAQELSAGVIRMKVEKRDDLFLTLKPGSYEWPVQVWNF